MSQVLDREKTFVALVEKGGWGLDRLTWRLRDTFRDISWQGKDVCEIGCGRGDYGMYLALRGARSVVALEPHMEGSAARHAPLLRERVEKLALPNYTLREAKFQDCHFDSQSLDIIFGIQVIEHIHETFKPLAEDPAALAEYQSFFAECHRILRPGGVLLFTDYSRTNVWRLLQKVFGPKFKGPLTRTIEWQMHQHPRTWKQLAARTGFARTRLWWRVYYPLRRVPWVADNRFLQYFAFASFVFSAYKQA